MIRVKGIIYEHHKSPVENKSHPQSTIASRRGLKGDSGVGQAPELPLRPRQRKKLQSNLSATNSLKAHSRLLTTFGNVLVLFSILGFLFTYGPIIKVEIGYRLSRMYPASDLSDELTRPSSGFAELLGKELLGEPEGVPDPNFSLIIPKIHAKGKVVSNVDPSDERGYMEALKVGVAHAAGTQLPGDSGNIYMFAHSTDSPINIIRYNAVFYLLRELEMGDEIEVYYAGVKHRYIVIDKKIVEPTDVHYLTPTNGEDKEILILQTCWPPGTTLKRLLIFAEKKVG